MAPILSERTPILPEMENSPDLDDTGNSTELPPTDPDEIESLWDRVRGKSTENTTEAPSANGSKGPATRSSRGLVEESPISEATYPSNSGTSGDTATASDISKATKLGPRNATFNDRVLEPRGIRIHQYQLLTSNNPFVHFKTSKLNDYGKDLGHENIPVWLEFTDVEIQTMNDQYLDMKKQALCGAEYEWYTLSTVLKGRPVPADTPHGSRMCVSRLLRLSAVPKGPGWVCPAIIHTSMPAPEYTFDIRPACAYWLSTKIFNDELEEDVYSIIDPPQHGNAFLPYFTVEFAESDESKAVAESRLAAAGAIALFNRWRLDAAVRKVGRKDAEGKPRYATAVEDIRHYGLTVVEGWFKIWVLKPTLLDGKWAGCAVQNVGMGDCSKKRSLTSLTYWINEIHRWGITVHGPACKAAMMDLMKPHYKGDISYTEWPQGG